MEMRIPDVVEKVYIYMCICIYGYSKNPRAKMGSVTWEMVEAMETRGGNVWLRLTPWIHTANANNYRG